MPDRVTPFAGGRGPRLGTGNGFGWAMMGLTRVDESGRCFATRWVTALGLPLVPLDRYYLKETGMTVVSHGFGSTTTTRYEIFGVAPLRGSEIIRTYLYCWLFAPLLGAGPTILLLSDADDVSAALPGGVIALIVLFVLLLIASIMLLVAIHGYYRKHWAPLREPEWR
ncbi:hypothetical protein GCM10023191_091810 [Actinoallomurus oryzae]|uniref:Uncharacterized protein n=1 Tax=Actinoallomurus oryzae TaxID=502180 RepID=A0ABP8R4N0_9ACTN